MRIFLFINKNINQNRETDVFDNLREKCGIVSVWSPTAKKQLQLALVVAGGVQHRGQQGAGLCSNSGKRLTTYHGPGLLMNVFPEKKIKTLDKPSIWTMVHCRYGTSGDWEPENIQPCIVKDTFSNDKIVVIHNGQFSDVDSIRRKLKGKFKKGLSDTYLFTQLLAQIQGDSWDERIKKALDQVDGAFSLIIGIGNVLYLVRDSHGLRPFFMGKVNKSVVAASETHALDKVNATQMVEVNPGAIVKFDSDGMKYVRRGSRKGANFCDLERAYFSRPDSMWMETHSTRGKLSKKWVSFSKFRFTSGERMAEEVQIKNATFVTGVPNSGVEFATGFAMASGLPYIQSIIRDHHDVHGAKRLFLGDDEKQKIGSKVLGKLSLIQDVDLWAGSIVVLGDDSLIRGNVASEITHAVYELGAREVHWVIGFPPVKYRCHLGVSMRTESELIASVCNGDAHAIAKEVGAVSVTYISNEAFIRAFRPNGKFVQPDNPEDIFLVNGGCGGCITGKYPA